MAGLTWELPTCVHHRHLPLGKEPRALAEGLTGPDPVE